jgi:hypothetical protein
VSQLGHILEGRGGCAPQVRAGLSMRVSGDAELQGSPGKGVRVCMLCCACLRVGILIAGPGARLPDGSLCSVCSLRAGESVAGCVRWVHWEWPSMCECRPSAPCSLQAA